jgi:hypothetical protein
MTKFADRRVKWTLDDGTVQEHDAVLQPGDYYAEIPKGRACAFSASLIYDGDIEATATLEGNDVPAATAVATTHAAVGVSGWVSWATELGTKTMTGTEGAATWQVVDFESARARVKLVVTVAGVCTLWPTVGTN